MVAPQQDIAGFTRVSFSYFVDNAAVDFIIDAVKFVARHAGVLCKLYTFDHGQWVHQAQVEEAKTFEGTVGMVLGAT